MSHTDTGPLSAYNSLLDKNLAGYFGNSRMRQHLRKNGLVNRRGELISENQYRVNMARKEHKKHVKDLLAQAIVHKSLDLERFRQVEIKKKLEEIAKIEVVRRVRAERKHQQDEVLMPLLSSRSAYKAQKAKKNRKPPHFLEMERIEIKGNLRPSSATQNSATTGRKGDEEVLPYLSPRSMSRPTSERPSERCNRSRPKSAPAPRRQHKQSRNGYVDTYDDKRNSKGLPVVPPDSYRKLVIYVDDDGRPVSPPPSKGGDDSIRSIRADDIDTRHLYALDSQSLQKYALALSKMERGDGASSPYIISLAPTPPRHARSRSARNSARRGKTANRPMSPYRTSSERKSNVQSIESGHPRSDPNAVEGSLMLHRQEPAMHHQGEVQTLCEITMKYHGPNLTLPRDQRDPTQEVSIDQQHCGGNTLPVFREKLQAGTTFTFVSRRHRGYPFSLTLCIDGRVDCRVSTCCEYKHAVGVKLGGKMGHFSLTGVTGATPCYKCKLSVQAPPRRLKVPRSKQKSGKSAEPLEEEVTVEREPSTPRKPEPVTVQGEEADDYEDDFEDEDSKDSSYRDDFETDDDLYTSGEKRVDGGE